MNYVKSWTVLQSLAIYANGTYVVIRGLVYQNYLHKKLRFQMYCDKEIIRRPSHDRHSYVQTDSGKVRENQR